MVSEENKAIAVQQELIDWQKAGNLIAGRVRSTLEFPFATPEMVLRDLCDSLLALQNVQAKIAASSDKCGKLTTKELAYLNKFMYVLD